MTNELAVFSSGDFTARTFTDEDGTIWVVAKDVAQSLGYEENSLNQMNNLLAPVPEIWKGHKRIMVRSENGVEQKREMLCLTEQGLYFFLGRSDKKAALPYQIWVADKVVPSIRKHGIYMTPDKAEEIISNPDFVIKLAQQIKEKDARIQQLEIEKKDVEELAQMLDQQRIENRPKVIFSEAVDASNDSVLVGVFAKLLRQNGIQTGQTRLFEWFRKHGFLCNCKGERWNMPTQLSIEKGLFEIKKSAVNNPDGSTIIRHTPKITGKGQIYFMSKFLDGEFVID